MNRENNVVTLSFEPLEHVTNITLTIRWGGCYEFLYWYYWADC
jgi:hypothetical protein